MNRSSKRPISTPEQKRDSIQRRWCHNIDTLAFPYSTLWSKGTEEHNSAAENVWKELPSFYTQTAYVFTTNIVIYRLIFSQYVWMRISFHLYFIVEALSTFNLKASSTVINHQSMHQGTWPSNAVNWSRTRCVLPPRLTSNSQALIWPESIYTKLTHNLL